MVNVDDIGNEIEGRRSGREHSGMLEHLSESFIIEEEGMLWKIRKFSRVKRFVSYEVGRFYI